MNHKQFRSLLKKFRRKFKRQALAKARDEQKEHAESCSGDAVEDPEELLARKLDDEECERQHLLWLQREKQAQEIFLKKLKLEEFQKTTQEIMNQKEEMTSPQKERATVIQERKDELSKLSLNTGQEDGPCVNPVPPVGYNVAEREKCLFYQKTGCCRFGDRCSRSHPTPENSVTLLIKGMYSHISIDQLQCDDYDADTGLEYEDKEMYRDFCNFYDDVLPEFKKAGKVCQFKVCCNHEPHLRGNVYVQYSRREEAEEAFKSFNGRWYGGKQLSCEFTEIKNWKSAICGLYHRNCCPKGSSCNFLHVYKNPGNEFWAADQNIDNRQKKRKYRHYGYRSPTRHRNSNYSSHRNSYYNPHRNLNYSPYRNSNYSPDHSRRKNRKRSSSRERYVRSPSSSSSSSSSTTTSTSSSSSSSSDSTRRHKRHKSKRKRRSKTKTHRPKKRV